MKNQWQNYRLNELYTSLFRQMTAEQNKNKINKNK
jgi:hypothetical protein